MLKIGHAKTIYFTERFEGGFTGVQVVFVVSFSNVQPAYMV